MPGQRFLELQPNGIELLSGRLRDGSVAISATNGKTTTATLTAALLARGGATPVHNRAGANFDSGVATTLVAASRRGGRMAGDVGVFEVDEQWLPPVARQLRPRAVLLANLFRDQLDRFGELESLLEGWAGLVTSLAPETAFVLNADDPAVADLGAGRPGVTYFGVDDPAHGLPGLDHAADAKHCRRCGAAYEYAAAFLAHLGHYRCPACGRERPRPDVGAERVRLDGLRGSSMVLRTPGGSAEVRLRLPGLYNVYNATAAAALGLALGSPLERVVGALEAAVPVAGRADHLQVSGRPTVMLLVKNPAGGNAVLRTLELEADRFDLIGVLNDETNDGRDVSWIWDVDLEPLAPRLRSVTCSGTRAGELAVRLKYAGVPARRIGVEPDLAAAVDRGVAGDGPLYVLANYTAMHALRPVLLARADGA